MPTETSSMLSIDPASCETQQIYKLMTGLIVPRPIALVSTIDSHGVPNLAPFSFYTGVGSNPPTLLFCTSLRKTEADNTSHHKDTLRNVEETREFVINIVSESIAEAANATAAEVPPEIDEFSLSGLTPLPSEVVKPARVAESPAQIECKLLQTVYSGREIGSGVVVLGQVVRYHIRPDLFDNFRIDPEGLQAVGRMAGMTWLRTHDHLEIQRP